MKRPIFFAISLFGNLVLAVSWLLVWRVPVTGTDDVPSPASMAARPEATPLPAPAEIPAAAETSWRLIASADYRQYIANLRDVGCPEWLIRDIIVAAIDDAYQQKDTSDPADFAPWQGADRRRQASRRRSAKQFALRQEKRTLVKSLLGYEWDSHANDVWDEDLLASFTLGFLPDDKVPGVLFLKDKYTEAAQGIRADVNYILIKDDRTRLQALYQDYQAELSRQLDPSELDEFQLRAQKDFLLFNDVHFDGVQISPEELRELVRLSKAFKDMALNEFVSDRPRSDAEQARGEAAFEAQVKTLLGSERFADYQRAQDAGFREILEFSRRNRLPQSAAVQVYAARQNAAAQADEIQNDATLSPGQRGEALAVLKAATMNTISTALGGNYRGYLQGPGQWLESLVPSPEIQTPAGPP
jgi:hypothetical protein